jgi:predicted transcriptional regulator
VTDGGRPDSTDRPVSTAERVLNALRAGAGTVDEVVAATNHNASVVGITLTRLYRNGIVDRSRAPLVLGRAGQPPWVYRLKSPPADHGE